MENTENLLSWRLTFNENEIFFCLKSQHLLQMCLLWGMFWFPQIFLREPDDLLGAFFWGNWTVRSDKLSCHSSFLADCSRSQCREAVTLQFLSASILEIQQIYFVFCVCGYSVLFVPLNGMVFCRCSGQSQTDSEYRFTESVYCCSGVTVPTDRYSVVSPTWATFVRVFLGGTVLTFFLTPAEAFMTICLTPSFWPLRDAGSA